MVFDITVSDQRIRGCENKISEVLWADIENALLHYNKARVIDRKRIGALLTEQHLGVSGYVDDATAQKIGHLTGAAYLVFLSIIEMDYITFRLNTRVIKTETAEVVVSFANYIQNDAWFLKLVNRNVLDETTSEKVGLFDNYHIYSDIALLGYNYSPENWYAFTCGFWGVYSNFGWGSNSDATNFFITVGYNFTVVPKRLYAALGIGGGISDPDGWDKEPIDYFILEAGFLLRTRGPLYLLAQYRYLASYKHSFGVGLGYLWY